MIIVTEEDMYLRNAVVVAGTGKRAEEFIFFAKEKGFPIIAVWETEEQKWGTTFHQIPVISLEELETFVEQEENFPKGVGSGILVQFSSDSLEEQMAQESLLKKIGITLCVGTRCDLGEESPRRTCPVCGESAYHILHSYSLQLPEEYHLSEDYDIVVCSSCDMIYQNFDLTKADYDHYYTHCNFYPTRPVPAENKIIKDNQEFTIDFIAENVSLEARIIDIGSGSGWLLKGLKEKGYQNLFAMDPSEESIQQITKFGIQGVLGSVYDKVSNYKESFDLVISIGCFEHFLEPKKALETCSYYVKEGGQIFLAVPDVSLLKQSEIPFPMVFHHEHINQFSERTIRNLMRQYEWEEVCHKKFILQQEAESMYFGFFEKNEHFKTESDKESIEVLKDFLEKQEDIRQKKKEKIDALVQSGKKIVIWGVGAATSDLAKNSNLLQGPILAVVDGNPTKQGMFFSDFVVSSPKILSEMKEDFVILLCVNTQRAKASIIEEIEKNQWGIEIVLSDSFP